MDISKLSPAMKQYWLLKQENVDAFLFYRMGDFYEMSFDDAKQASKLLDLTLTGKECGLKERAPMCGVPYHSAEGYINRLTAMGYKVAICEQLEDPATAKGIVTRGITRRVTPGTVVDTQALEEGKNNFICAIVRQEDRVGLCYADVSAGVFRCTHLQGDCVKKAVNEVAAFHPKEVLLVGEIGNKDSMADWLKDANPYLCRPTSAPDPAQCGELIYAQTGKTPEELQLHDYPETVSAVGVLLYYLKNTTLINFSHMRELVFYRTSAYMDLPWTTRYSLELTETMVHRAKKGSLLEVIDMTRSALGGRTLRSWLEQPLCSLPEILRRQNAVEALAADTVARREIGEKLGDIYDLERLMGSITYGSANARTLYAIGKTALVLPALKELLTGLPGGELEALNNDIDAMTDLADHISRAICDEPPFTVREGKMIREGYCKELDELIYVAGHGRELVLQYEAEERERIGLKGMRTGYNRVFGYYIEIPKSNDQSKIPPEYIRKQTTVNTERYISPALKELESMILQAEGRANTLEYELFCALRDEVKAAGERLMRTAYALGRLDALASLAEAAVRYRYVRPEISVSGELRIVGGRHPVVERMRRDTVFVPNDTLLDRGDNRLAIITGPNMAGKSTYMRQVALIVILAQIGSFVPAESATVGIVDKIFTRIGASDELAAGKSTFMVEMSETAYILENATGDSLLIFDEIGRGTSTFDGMAIARAVLEHAANPRKLGAKTLFATHYHELTRLEETLPGIKNYQITAKKRGDELIFLRKIVPGGADDSYGIDVGKLAGLPKSVITRAKEILQQLEQENGVEKKPVYTVPTAEDNPFQDALTDGKREELLQELKGLQADTMTPIEALNTLYRLSKEARELLS